jgi:hypothetical protein
MDETVGYLEAQTWWLCSRIDEGIEEPRRFRQLDPRDELLSRLDAGVDEALAFLLAVPRDERAVTHVPRRHPSRDPGEAWTHAKVCRRQAEILVEHLADIPRAVQSAAEA